MCSSKFIKISQVLNALESLFNKVVGFQAYFQEHLRTAASDVTIYMNHY